MSQQSAPMPPLELSSELEPTQRELWQKGCLSLVERYLPCDSVETRPGGILAALPPLPIALRVFAQPNGVSAGYTPQEILSGLPPTRKGQRLAILGESGTGKTLFLQYLAKVLLADPQADTVLWLSPFQLKNISLRDYLFGSWLAALAEFTEWPLADTQAFLEEEIRGGRVWILADGMDYLYSDLEAEKVSGPLSLLGRSLQPWGNNLHLVLVCRPETQRQDTKGLRDFRLFHTRELSYPDMVEGTIQEWFLTSLGLGHVWGEKDPQGERRRKAEQLGQTLCQVLAQPDHETCRQWLTRPIRLILCCRFWQSRPSHFPVCSAELYRILTQQFYQWKAEQASVARTQQQALAHCLGELGKIILLERRSHRQALSQSDVDKVFGKDSPLLKLSLQLGWLIPRGLVEEHHWQRGYSFFDPTFRDYFTALNIDDWHFFLDTNTHCYRLFERPWQRVMTFWWGRSDIPGTEKAAFLAALFTFNDHCGRGNFYGKQAQALAVKALREFQDPELARQILSPLPGWCRHSDDFPPALTVLAESLLGQTHRPLLIQILLAWLQTEEEESLYRQVCGYLARWGQGNAEAIAGLEAQLTGVGESSLRFQVADTLGSIDPGNAQAIAVYESALETATPAARTGLLLGLAKVGRGVPPVVQSILARLPQSFTAQEFRHFRPCLELIGQENQGVLARLLQALRIQESGSLRCQIAECLERIDPGSPTALSVLVRLLQKTVEPEIRQQALYSLGEVSAGQAIVIQALSTFLDQEEDLFLRWLAVSSLAKVGQAQGHRGAVPDAIAALEKQLNLVQADLSQEANRGLLKEIIEALVKLDPTNPLLLNTLSQLLETQTDPNTLQEYAALLGQLDPGHPEAIAVLLRLIKQKQDEFLQLAAANSLGKIDPGNLKAVMALVSLLQNSLDTSIRALAATYLGDIGQQNPVVTATLIRALQNHREEQVQRAVIQSLGKVGRNNKEVAQALLERLIATSSDSDTTGGNSAIAAQIVDPLIKVLPVKMLPFVVHQLRANLQDNPYHHRLYSEILWHCATVLNYPAFYQAWQERPLDSESLSLPVQSLRFSHPSTIQNNAHQYLRHALMDMVSANPDLIMTKVIWIDCEPLLATPNLSGEIYQQMQTQGCPPAKDGFPQTPEQLQRYWLTLQKQSPDKVYLLICDHISLSYPLPLPPELLDCLQKLAQTAHQSVTVLTEQQDLPLTHFSPRSPKIITEMLEWMTDSLS